MMDLVAGALGIDPLEVRRRNAVREMPWRSPSGRRLDSGDYLALLDLLEPEYSRLRRDQAAARADGRMFGVGIGLFNEISASGSTDYRQRGVTSIPGTDGARVVVTAERRIEIYTSAADAGQGHADTYRALAEQELGVSPDQVDVIEGDTTACPYGSGTFISRGAVGVVACVVDALREAAKRDLEPGTDVTHVHDPSQVYPAGAHLAAVEVDPVSLVAKVVRYIAVEDCGRLIHPEIVDGQIRGGVAMGIGQQRILFAGPGAGRGGERTGWPKRMATMLPLVPST